MKKFYFFVSFLFLVVLSVSAQQNQAKINSSGVLLGSGTTLANFNITLTNTGNSA